MNRAKKEPPMPSEKKRRKRKPIVNPDGTDSSGCNNLGNGNWLCRGFYMRRVSQAERLESRPRQGEGG